MTFPRVFSVVSVSALKILIRQFCELCQMSEQSSLQRLADVYRYRKPHGAAGLAVDVMASADAKQCPVASLNDPSELATGNRFHAGNSSIRSVPPGSGGATSMERQPSMASWRFCMSSSMVSPSVAQPGIAGTSAQ